MSFLTFQELIVEYNRYRISEFPDMEGSRHTLKMVFRELQVKLCFCGLRYAGRYVGLAGMNSCLFIAGELSVTIQDAPCLSFVYLCYFLSSLIIYLNVFRPFMVPWQHGLNFLLNAVQGSWKW